MNENEIFIDDSVPLVRVSDMSYPMYFNDVRVANPNMGFPYPIRMDVLATVGYAPVFDTPKPDGDVVTNGLPEQHEDGFWYQTWVVRDYTPEEVAEALFGKKYFSNFNAVEVLRSDREKGVDYTVEDKTYKLSLEEVYLNALYTTKNHLELQPSAEVKFRTKDGSSLTFDKDSYEQFYNFTLESYYNLINNYWDYLQKMNAVTDLKSYPEEPTTFIQ